MFEVLEGAAGPPFEAGRHMEAGQETNGLPVRVDHELRTPLTLVLGNIETLLARSGLPSDTVQALRSAHRNALLMLRTIDGLLDLSRGDEGNLRARVIPVDLAARTDAILSKFMPAAAAAGLVIESDIDTVGEVSCDPEMWDKILLNLLSNALKFTFEGKISVALHKRDSAVVLTVADTGIGVGREHIPHLFDRFYNAGERAGRSDSGAGIGLAVAKRMIEALQGEITVESTVGEGTRFTVTLPDDLAERLGPGLARPHGRRSSADAFIAEALRWTGDGDGDLEGTADVATLRFERPARTGLPRVVVIDANPDMRSYVMRLLAPYYAAAEVVSAKTMEIEAAPDLFVVGGLEEMEALRSMGVYDRVPILVMVDRPELDDHLGYPEADDYVAKPFTSPEMLARVRNLLDRARLRFESESMMRQAQRMEAVGKLTGGISHDFSNLLVAALGNLDMASKRVEDASALRFIENARRAAERGAKLTRHLLAFSQNRESRPQSINANEAVSSMGDLLTRTFGGMFGISLRLGKSVWPISADPAALELAILNIALNARDAMPEGGDLTISTDNVRDSYGDMVRISITDTGMGMDVDTRSKATEPFFTTKGAGSTGLGLSQVAETLERVGGRLTIDSIPGRGTTVEMYFPRSVTEPAKIEQPAASAVDSYDILLVDDDPGVREIGATLLSELGHRVTQAAGGREAVVILESKSFDLLLTDYAMPDMTGVEVSTRARALHPGIRVLFATGYADIRILDERREIVMHKPFDIAELTLKIASAMAVPRPSAEVVRLRPGPSQ